MGNASARPRASREALHTFRSINAVWVGHQLGVGAALRGLTAGSQLTQVGMLAAIKLGLGVKKKSIQSENFGPSFKARVTSFISFAFSLIPTGPSFDLTG